MSEPVTFLKSRRKRYEACGDVADVMNLDIRIQAFSNQLYASMHNYISGLFCLQA